MDSQIDLEEMELQEQWARICRQIAAINHHRIELSRSDGATGKFGDLTNIEPWKLMAGSMTFGAALFAASVVFTKLYL
ncbi:MAG: hypothetical protein AAGL10_10570 [Pseudomonadota bacterium]